jgi:hypothetical protein
MRSVKSAQEAKLLENIAGFLFQGGFRQHPFLLVASFC